MYRLIVHFIYCIHILSLNLWQGICALKMTDIVEKTFRKYDWRSLSVYLSFVSSIPNNVIISYFIDYWKQKI